MYNDSNDSVNESHCIPQMGAESLPSSRAPQLYNEPSFPQYQPQQFHHQPNEHQQSLHQALPLYHPSPQFLNDSMPQRRWSCDDNNPDLHDEQCGSTSSVHQHSSVNDVLAMAAAGPDDPAYYHNLGQIVNNHLHMSNRRHTEFDYSVGVSKPSSPTGLNNQSEQFPVNINQKDHFIEKSTIATPEKSGPVPSRPNRLEMRHQSHSLHHHHPYRDGAIFENEFYANNSRSISAPNVGNDGTGCAQASAVGLPAPIGAVNAVGVVGGNDFGARRRFRTNFTEQQSLFLEDSFRESHYPDHKSKKDMAIFLNIPEDRITVWFQNRRAKWRRKELRDKERSRGDSYASPSSSFDYSCYQGPSSSSPLLTPNSLQMNLFPEHQIRHQNFDLSMKQDNYQQPSQFHHEISSNPSSH